MGCGEEKQDVKTLYERLTLVEGKTEKPESSHNLMSNREPFTRW